jgi:hypothetical protein
MAPAQPVDLSVTSAALLLAATSLLTLLVTNYHNETELSRLASIRARLEAR